MSDVLSARALNRATLARQALLERSGVGALEMIEHLVGMQAQAPEAPYVGLWTRLRSFRPAELAALLIERRAVRLTLMRGTVHLVTARDGLVLRPRLQALLASRFSASPFARELKGVDLEAVKAAGRELLADGPRPRIELGRALAERWPGRDPTSLAYAVDYLTPTLQAPPRGVWGAGGAVALASLERWLGQPCDEALPLEELVLRYLGAFGPASIRDIQCWCGLTRLAEVVERLRSRLCRFHDEAGCELFDRPEAPRPDPDTPAPPRFLPAYDNLLLSHADRRRVIPDGRPVPLPPGNGARRGTLLLDGYFGGTWKVSVDGDAATLFVEPFAPLAQPEAVVAEGERLLTFVAAEAARRDVRISRAGNGRIPGRQA